MWIITYVAGVLTTATLLLMAFLRDESTPLTCYRSWLLLAIASMTWPVSLPLAGLEHWNNRHGKPSVIGTDIGTETSDAAHEPERDSTLIEIDK